MRKVFAVMSFLVLFLNGCGAERGEITEGVINKVHCTPEGTCKTYVRTNDNRIFDGGGFYGYEGDTIIIRPVRDPIGGNTWFEIPIRTPSN